MTQIDESTSAPATQPAPIARVPRGQVCVAVDGIDGAATLMFCATAQQVHRIHPGSRVIISIHDDSDTAGSPYPRNYTLGPNGEMIAI